jgi:predicted 3-demethylubiquinone-9 3-methyltransferase (glyoxalase superfamily)
MDKVSTWLWCDGTAEEMAAFYTGLIPDSRIVEIVRSPADYPAARPATC